MIIKIKAVVVCDNCDAEVECAMPLELGSPAWSCVFKRPELTQGRIVMENHGHDEQKYLCAECEKARGYNLNDYDGGG
jgi:hypothetical protein